MWSVVSLKNVETRLSFIILLSACHKNTHVKIFTRLILYIFILLSKRYVISHCMCPVHFHYKLRWPSIACKQFTFSCIIFHNHDTCHLRKHKYATEHRCWISTSSHTVCWLSIVVNMFLWLMADSLGIFLKIAKKLHVLLLYSQHQDFQISCNFTIMLLIRLLINLMSFQIPCYTM